MVSKDSSTTELWFYNTDVLCSWKPQLRSTPASPFIVSSDDCSRLCRENSLQVAYFPLRRNCLDKSEVIKEPKNRQYGKLQVLDAKEMVIEPAEAMSRKGLLRNGKELASKPHTPAIQSSQNTKISPEKKKISSKSNENKDLFMNLDNKSQTASIVEEKTEGTDPNISAPKETIPQEDSVDHNSKGTDEDAALANTVKNDESSESPEDRLSETIKHDNEKGCNSTTVFIEKNVAPLELMTEFLRAVMGRNYTVAKKLCEMILVYEPENPEAKQFSSLIEEKLLMEKTHSHEEESEDSSDDSEESSDDESEDSSDESEDT
ncbi:glutamate-rich protein 2 [Gracilinanus agilis]|uniref:glutamate-rich protein 2 n=1 Tax=Gracilinanus agilis TaxID=191870 RepID=UPI001CFCA9C3|nr:glutamate-rich protein 2 [Gracilinanus agilis]